MQAKENSTSIIRAIIKKVTKAGLIRHINGNTGDNQITNLAYVTVLQAFQNKTWVVDAECSLTPEEFAIWSKARNEWNGDMSLFK